MSLIAWWCLFLHVLGLHGHLYRHSRSWNGYSFHTYPHPAKRPVIPRNVMVDVINDLGLKLLAIHNEYNENNIAISPYGALSVLVALGEGLEGDAVYEIQQATHIPSDISVIRIGLRDIHRHLKSYFIPKEGFLSGLTLNHENVTLRPEYEQILRFYGYDTTTFNNALYPQSAMPGTPQPITERVTTAYPQTTTGIMRTGAAEMTTDGFGGATVPTDTTTVQQSTEKPTDTTTTIINTEATSFQQDSTTTTLPLLASTEIPMPVMSVDKTSTTAGVTLSTFTTEKLTTTQLPTSEQVSTTANAENPTTSELPKTEENTSPFTLTTQLITEESTSGVVTTPLVITMSELSTISEDLTSTTSTNQAKTETTQAGTTTTSLTTNVPSTTRAGTIVFEFTTVGSTTTDLPTTITEYVSDPGELIFAQTTIKNDNLETSTRNNDLVITSTSGNVDTATAVTVDITSPINTETTTSETLVKNTNIPDALTLITSNSESSSITQSTINDDIFVATSPISVTSTVVDIVTTGTDTTTVNTLATETTTDNKLNEIGADPSTPGFGGISKRRVRSDAIKPDQTNVVRLNIRETLLDNNNDFPFKRNSRSVVDYLIARYYDDQFNFHDDPPYIPEDQPSFLVYGKYREYHINFMKYNTVLPFYYEPHLNAMALSFPLDSTKYYLLLLLPVDETGIDKLICDLRLNGSIKYIIANLQYRHVIATIPSFKLKGFVTLTPSFQKLGIRKVFEPRQADFAPMTNQSGIYVTNIEQSITVTIRNYVDPEIIQGHRNLHRYDPVYFKADHPFLYFVIDSEIHVSLMAGKIVNPLNTRIS